MKTLIILNPHAGSGRAGRLWSKIEPLLWQELGELVVAVTQRPEEIAPHLESARAAGLTRVIAIGGDGTNHSLVNELVRLNQRHPGSLPMGTGQDWARSLGVPLTPEAAVRWIKEAHPAPLDVGCLIGGTGPDKHFLNIASVGIGGVVSARINRLPTRRPWTFYRMTLEGLLSYRPQYVTVKLDGKTWYEGKIYAVAVANGQTFGHGMRIAPYAIYNDNLFDIVLIEGMPRLEAALALNTVYSGAHLKRADVHSARAHTIEIEGNDGPLPVELDGEAEQGKTLHFEVISGALSTLVNHSSVLTVQ